jgi:hypothetical protein
MHAFWTRDLPRRSAGCVTSRIAPLDRAGIELQEMLRLFELGTVAFKHRAA